MMNRMFFILPLLLSVVGCAKYEYDLLRPAEFARHVGPSVDTDVRRDPLDYKLRTLDNRLVVRIFNPTDEPIALLGQKSTVVDPDGQSRPLRDLTIAPGSFGKLILPPMKPRLERQGPSIGIGIGGVFGDARRRRDDDPSQAAYLQTTPRYLAVLDDDALYWDWDGETSVTLTLVFERGGNTFTHDFAIQRRKM